MTDGGPMTLREIMESEEITGSNDLRLECMKLAVELAKNNGGFHKQEKILEMANTILKWVTKPETND